MIIWRCLLVCGGLLMISLDASAMRGGDMEALYAAADAHARAHRFWGESLVALFAQHEATQGSLEVDVRATHPLLEGTRPIDFENLPDLFARKFGEEGTFYTARSRAYHLYLHCRDSELPSGGVLRRTVHERAPGQVLMFWEHADAWGDITGIVQVGMLPAGGMMGSRLPLTTKTRETLGFSHQEFKVFRALSNFPREDATASTSSAEAAASAPVAPLQPQSARSRMVALMEGLTNSKLARDLVRALRAEVLAKSPALQGAMDALRNAPFDEWRSEIIRLYQSLPSGRTKIAERLLQTQAFQDATQR